MDARKNKISLALGTAGLIVHIMSPLLACVRELDTASLFMALLDGCAAAILGAVGVIATFAWDAALALAALDTPWVAVVPLCGYAAGLMLLLCGLAYYADAKGRSAWWCYMAFLGVMGWIVLGCLSDRTLGRMDIEHVGGYPGGVRPKTTSNGKRIRTSSLAMWSLILGVLGLLTGTGVPLMLMFAVPAVICGHLSRRAIRRAPERLKGGGLALTGLVTGLIGCTMGVVVLMLQEAAENGSSP